MSFLTHCRANSIPAAALALLALSGLAAAGPEERGRPAVPPGVETCFDAGTEITPELMAQFNTLRGQAAGPFDDRFNFNGSRRNGFDNTAVVLTYSYCPDGTPLANSTDTSSLFSNLDSRFGNNRELWQYEMDAVFSRYSELTGITFVRTTDDGAPHPNSPGVPGVRGDIRIAMRPIDGQGHILAFAGNDIVLDSAEDWGSYAGSFIRLRNVLSHEVGHAIGLSHVCPLTHSKLMEPIYTPDFDGPRHDDIRALQQIYGDAFEPNQSAASAFPMTDSLPQTSFTFFNYPYADNNPAVTTASISTWWDVDYYKSFLGARMPVSITITPTGMSYDDSDQLENGDCASGNFVNTLTAARVGVSLLAADGTVLATAVGANPGQPVSIVNASVPGGNYYVKVFTPDAWIAGPQGYTMTRTIGSPQPPANDLCVNAPYFWNGPVYGTTFGAGAEGTAWLDRLGNSDTFNTRGDVYYTFIASHTGRIEAFTTNAGNPVGHGQAVTIHTGCNATRANQLPIPDTNHCGIGSIYADVVAGQQYMIRVGSLPGQDWGGFTLDLHYLNAPANDRCETAAHVGPGTVLGTTQYARRELNLPCVTTYNSPTAWYAYTAPYTNTVRFDTCGTNGMDTALAAYDSCPADVDAALACNDDSPCGLSAHSSAISLRVIRGQTVYVRVSGYHGDSGDFIFTVTQGPVENDTCATALRIDGGQSVPFNNAYATTDMIAEGLLGFCCGDLLVNHDLWYRYTAPARGTLTVDTFGSGFDTKLAAYSACPTASNQAITGNDDAAGGYQSWMRFTVEAGQTYLIRVGGYLTAVGDGYVNTVFTPAPCPSDFNDDGFVDFFDSDAFLACFEGVTCPAGKSADFNNDGFVDFFDMNDFIDAFEAGC